MAAAISELLAILDKPKEISLKLLVVLNIVELQCLSSVKRDDSDEGPNTKLVEASVGKTKHIVEKPVVVVPKRIFLAAHVLHGRSNVDVVLEELECEAFVRLVLTGQFQSNAHQVEAEHAHPAGGI